MDSDEGPRGLQRHRRRRHYGPPRWVVPLAVGFVQIMGTIGAAQHDGIVLPALAIVALGASAGALWFRRRRPIPTVAAVVALTWTAAVVGTPDGPIYLALIIAFVNVGIRADLRAAAISVVLGAPAFIWGVPAARGEPLPSPVQALPVIAWVLVLFAGALWGRSRRDRAVEFAHRRREEQRRQASEERLRIAQELHDVLAHNISLMNVQAGVALHLMDERPEQARTALTAIKQASNDALGELRSVLDILRGDGEAAPRTPTSGLRDLDQLVERTRAAGLDVSVRIEGTPRTLPPGVDLAAYRIVQESLTNVTRHAVDATAAVVVEYRDDDLVVRVDDTGRGTPSWSTDGGNGIPGMKERAAALGGTLDAGPRPSGGFSVSATLPTRERSR